MSTTPPVDSRPPSGPAPDKSTFVRVRTTLPRRPLPPSSTRQPILTPRLILRPLVEADLPAVHELRTQPEVMFWTAKGRPDRDIEETRSRLEVFFPPKDEATYNFALCDRESGALIGLGGSHVWHGQLGWPEVGYMFRKEYWGRGLATEFLGGWLAAWEGLEREEVEIEVDPRSVKGAEEGEEGSGSVREQVVALTVTENGKSQRVLGKNGFEWFVTWKDKDIREDAAPDSTVDLPTFRYFPGAKKAE